MTMTQNSTPRSAPFQVLDRHDEQVTLTSVLTQTRDNLHIYGPHGTGKTLVIDHVLEQLPPNRTMCYISCWASDTQYKVLHQLLEQLADESQGTGYHTVQLQRQVEAQLRNQDAVIVLDDLDFLLTEDGIDTLYTLSRLQETIQLVTVSANTLDLTESLDDRTYSSLQPRTITFTPYTVTQAIRILTDHAVDRLECEATDPALTRIATTTENIRLGLHWLDQAATASTDVITEEAVDATRTAALQRYHDSLLTPFSVHHQILLEAITLLTADRDAIHSGTVYNWYDKLCSTLNQRPMSTRRISDYLTHLELLGIIDVEHYDGGSKGKTRVIRLQQL